MTSPKFYLNAIPNLTFLKNTNKFINFFRGG